MHGVGGSESKYASTDSMGAFVPGERVLPMSFEVAFSWDESNLRPVEFSGEFKSAFMLKGEKVHRSAMNISIPPDLKAKLETARTKTGKSAPRIIADLIDEMEMP